MKLNRLLAGTLAIVLIAGFGIPVFALDPQTGDVPEGQGVVKAQEAKVFFIDTDLNLVTNGDIQTGDFTGWTQYTTANAILNPSIVSFDTDGDTVPTNSAQFNVGEIVFTEIEEGGGIKQTVVTGSGTV